MKEQASVLVFPEAFLLFTQANNICADGWKQRRGHLLVVKATKDPKPEHIALF
jgi:hypothetical protein